MDSCFLGLDCFDLEWGLWPDECSLPGRHLRCYGSDWFVRDQYQGTDLGFLDLDGLALDLSWEMISSDPEFVLDLKREMDQGLASDQP